MQRDVKRKSTFTQFCAMGNQVPKSFLFSLGFKRQARFGKSFKLFFEAGRCGYKYFVFNELDQQDLMSFSFVQCMLGCVCTRQKLLDCFSRDVTGGLADRWAFSSTDIMAHNSKIPLDIHSYYIGILQLQGNLSIQSFVLSALFFVSILLFNVSRLFKSY